MVRSLVHSAWTLLAVLQIFPTKSSSISQVTRDGLITNWTVGVDSTVSKSNAKWRNTWRDGSRWNLARLLPWHRKARLEYDLQKSFAIVGHVLGQTTFKPDTFPVHLMKEIDCSIATLQNCLVKGALPFYQRKMKWAVPIPGNRSVKYNSLQDNLPQPPDDQHLVRSLPPSIGELFVVSEVKGLPREGLRVVHHWTSPLVADPEFEILKGSFQQVFHIIALPINFPKTKINGKQDQGWSTKVTT